MIRKDDRTNYNQSALPAAPREVPEQMPWYSEMDHDIQTGPPTGCLLVVVFLIAAWAFIFCALHLLAKAN